MENIVAVIGLGYVGLPLACLCSKKGLVTIGFDINEKITNKLSKGYSHIKDDCIERLLEESKDSGNFFPTSSKRDIANADIYIICVPTPISSNKQPNLEPLFCAIRTISPYLCSGNQVIIESTVYPGTCEDIIYPLIEKLSGLSLNTDISLVHCPERVNPGDVFWTIENIPRVIGGTDMVGTRRAAEFYSFLLNGQVQEIEKIQKLLRPKFSINSNAEPVSKQVPMGSVTIMRSIRDAEAVKAMENTVRDVNIAFVNELAKISDALNLDVVDIIDGMSTKPFGKGPFYPGAGVGGHCIAVDPEWLKSASTKAGYMPEIIQICRNTNNSMPKYVVSTLKKGLEKIDKKINEINVAILGVAYKKNVDDHRESPFYDVRDILTNEARSISIYDSRVSIENTSNSLISSLDGCEAIIIVTDHSDMIKEFMELVFNPILNIKLIVDGRNCLDKKLLPNNILYYGVGRR